MVDEMTREQHAARHAQLHRMLDELAADYVSCTSETLSGTSVMDLIKWSHQQTLSPTESSTSRGKILDTFLPPDFSEQMHADSAGELTVQAIRVGAALVLRIKRGSDLVWQRVLGSGEETDVSSGQEPIRVNAADVRVSFGVRNRV